MVWPHLHSAGCAQMNNPIAVLVEDDVDQFVVSRKVLDDSHFEVRAFDAIGPAYDYLDGAEEAIDLFVLDRRLPMQRGQSTSDEFGDELLERVRTDYPDAKVIVFTGYASIQHVQRSMRGGGHLLARQADPIDRVTVFEKYQSVEFKKEVQKLRAFIQRLDDIEIKCDTQTGDLTYVDKRCIRRVAHEYAAVSISVAPLGGGLTGASVWKCNLSRVEGKTAAVIVKRVKKLVPLGGLPDLLSRNTTTSTMATVAGMMYGHYLNVLQAAGENPYSLMDVLKSDPENAVKLLSPICSSLSSLEEQQKILPLSEICQPLIEWEQLSTTLLEFGIAAPPCSMTATVRTALRHGDLHPANILVDEGSAVLIDFDSCDFAAALLDPITLLISTLVHPDSPLVGDTWPSPEHIAVFFGTREFGKGYSEEAWFEKVVDWCSERKSSDREFWALCLAYAGRQLGYKDVTSNPATNERVVSIARKAADALSGS